MAYPYDGIRSTIEYYNNKIDYLETKIKILESQNKEYLNMLLTYTQTDEELTEKVEKVKQYERNR